MRSKCRCSCVLQFTLRHAFSSVLHRPPSQLIHCIALCLGYQRQASMIWEKLRSTQLRPGEGVNKEPERPASLLRPPTVPAATGSQEPTLETNKSRAGSRLVDPTQTSEASKAGSSVRQARPEWLKCRKFSTREILNL